MDQQHKSVYYYTVTDININKLNTVNIFLYPDVYYVKINYLKQNKKVYYHLTCCIIFWEGYLVLYLSSTSTFINKFQFSFDPCKYII